MKFVIAPDSFKGSLSSQQVCDAISNGIKKVLPESEIILLPIADGGEGSLYSLMKSCNGKIIKIKVNNPLGKKITASYGVSENFAVIEMAQASGLSLLKKEEYNPFLASTYGTGLLIKDVIKKGYRKILICIGGSATVDGGAGMAQALGFEFFDDNGNIINSNLNNQKLKDVKSISDKNVLPEIKETEFIILSDVQNKLLGKNGAVYVYAKQKGATENDLPLLEENIKHFYDITEKYFSKKVRNVFGSGAAGGLGAGLLLFLDAKIESGIDYILNAINFSEKIRGVSYIFTGEGKIDSQTIYGKTISGVLEKAYKQNIPVIAICGAIDGDISELYKKGLKSVFSICNKPMNLSEAIENSESLIISTVENICRILSINK